MSVSAPDEGCIVGVVSAALAVGTTLEAHDVVPPLGNEHADDALDAVANEVASHLVRLFFCTD